MRPGKQGVDYFPLDVHLDDKFKFIEIKYKLEGFAIVIKLLQKIYSCGYWYQWTGDEVLLFADEIRAESELISKVVNECLERDIFDKDMYEKHQILTSKGIQKRYQEIVRRRKDVEIIVDYLLIDNNFGVNDGIMTASSKHNDSKSTQKKQKVNRNRKETKKSDEDIPPAPHEEIKKLYNEICKSLIPIRSLSENRKEKIRTRWKQLDFNIDNFKKVFEIVENSSFCKGSNDRGWKADFDWIFKNDENIIKVLEGKYDSKKALDEEPKSMYPEL